MAFKDDFDRVNAGQHALALSLCDLISSQQDVSGDIVTCYAQDPAYTDVDRSVLSQAGFIVLEDPRGFLELDDTSIVISFGADIPVHDIIADIARPAILIWDRVYIGEEREETSPQ